MHSDLDPGSGLFQRSDPGKNNALGPQPHTELLHCYPPQDEPVLLSSTRWACTVILPRMSLYCYPPQDEHVLLSSPGWVSTVILPRMSQYCYPPQSPGWACTVKLPRMSMYCNPPKEEPVLLSSSGWASTVILPWMSLYCYPPQDEQLSIRVECGNFFWSVRTVQLTKGQVWF